MYIFYPTSFQIIQRQEHVLTSSCPPVPSPILGPQYFNHTWWLATFQHLPWALAWSCTVAQTVNSYSRCWNTDWPQRLFSAAKGRSSNPSGWLPFPEVFFFLSPLRLRSLSWGFLLHLFSDFNAKNHLLPTTTSAVCPVLGGTTIVNYILCMSPFLGSSYTFFSIHLYGKHFSEDEET